MRNDLPNITTFEGRLMMDFFEGTFYIEGSETRNLSAFLFNNFQGKKVKITVEGSD